MRYIALFALSCAALTAASLTTAKPEDVGLSTDRLARINDMVDRHIKAGDISGAVTLVARHGQIAHLGVQGVMDTASKKAMAKDTVFRLASMTKPVVGTAIMMMLEEGKLTLSDPVYKFIPEFKGIKVGVLQTPGRDGKPPTFYTVPAEHEITIKDLLTHTSGLGSGPMGDSEAAKNPRKPTETLADYIPRLGATVLEFQPGSRWTYSPGNGFDTLGRIVEITSGMTLDKFFQTRIFDPLDMKETRFFATEAMLPRLVTAYNKTPDGLAKRDVQSSQVYFSGGGGLVSTVEDYSKFAQMLLNGGELGGKRLLSPRTVKLMSSVHIPSTLPGRGRGDGWGLSVHVVDDAVKGNIRISDGSYGWSGAYGTHFWVDPKEDIVAILMIQTSIPAMRTEFENAVMQSIVK